MANTQTTVPLFVANQVLTAAQQNASAGTGVPVFATTVTRDAAFGGSNKALAEGQLCYIEASDVVQYYTGAAWATVGPATAGALTFITGATFTTQTTVSLPANTFSATYSNYMIMFYSTTATAVSDVSIRFRAAGADNTTSNYIYSIVGFGSGGGTNNTSSNGTTSFATAGMNTAYITSAMFTIQEPQTANKSVILGSINGNGNTSTVLNLTRHLSGLFNATTSFDSLSFIGTDTMTGSYKVYGYSNS